MKNSIKISASNLARVALILGAGAVAGCSSLLANKPDEEESPFADYPIENIISAGDQALRMNQPDRAAFIYMQALQIEPSADLWLRFGQAKYAQDDKALAHKAVGNSIQLEPDNADAHELMGRIYVAGGQKDQARLHLNRATELNPDLWRAWNALGVLADLDKNYSGAVEFYTQGLVGAPQSAMLLNNIGYSYYLAGNLEQSVAWFGRALMNDGRYAPAVRNLALVYARRSLYDDAVRSLSKVVKPEQAYNDVGYIAIANGDYDEADELLREAVRLSPVYYEKAYENLAILEQRISARND